jgi:penicillin-binding protein 2
MKLAVSGINGTAWRAYTNEIEIAGKTGSTQIVAISQDERKRQKIDQRPYHLRDHALFVGYTPITNPRVAVVVVVEHGESGGRVATPLAKDIIVAAHNLVD